MITDSLISPERSVSELSISEQPARGDLLAQHKAVITNEFDAEFYIGQRSSLADLEVDPITHYLTTGWKELLDPSPYFSTFLYLESNKDVRDSGINPFVHFVGWGRSEGRAAKPATAEFDKDDVESIPWTGLATDSDVRANADNRIEYERAIIADEFDAAYYAGQAASLAALTTDPIIHYLLTGWEERFDPSPSFSTSYYLEANEDVKESGVNPFVHFIGWGRAEGRLPARPATGVKKARRGARSRTGLAPNKTKRRPEDDRLAYERALILDEFDADFYAAQSSNLVGMAIDPIIDYLQNGWKELRDPSPRFSTAYYLESNPDVKESGVNPFVHFLGWGRSEGRLALSVPADLQTEDSISPQPGEPEPSSAESLETQAGLAHGRTIIENEFDAEFYVGQRPDLEALPIDPIDHYLTAGWRDQLDPSPNFSTSYYLTSNQDVKASGANPFVHFVGWGRAEGRQGKYTPALTRADVEEQKLVSEMAAVRDYFDPAFYLQHSPDLAGVDMDLLRHYMKHGWRELRDPNPAFSTSYYLEQNSDLRSGGINPFFHYVMFGRKEGRKAQPYSARLALRDVRPLVTAIVPNYNHARFLRQRLESILQQSYENLEILILDDASTDNSAQIIREYEAKHPQRIRVILNAKNSGNVFAQWRKGIDNANGDLFWICESDDFCEPDFLQHCVKPFSDESVMISFGRIQFSDNYSKVSGGLDIYREQAEPGVWNSAFRRPASEWFRGTFAVSNIIPNVGGCVIRRQKVPENIWDKALYFRISGDWYLYCMMANGGQIAYVPEALAYFRQHGKNTSVSGFLKPHYYVEHEKLIILIREQWGTPDDIAVRFYGNIYRQFIYSSAEEKLGKLPNLYSNDRVLSSEKRRDHVLMCLLGFHLGGGELFPIHLANELLNQGYIVSVMCLDTENENPAVRNMLDKRIAVYDGQLIEEFGIDSFMQRAGIDIIHSHSISVEFLFFKKHRFVPKIPYIVTLHGSYEVTPISDDMLLRVIRAVSQWCYLSEKNLQHLHDIPISKDRIGFIANGMPADDRPFPKTRRELGIEDADILFMLCSRAIPEKGWDSAITAMKIAQGHTDRRLHLMLCGTGPMAEKLAETAKDDPCVHLMGFQENICGAYRMSDVAILPTRFAGESYPLSLIQALQVGCPIISTDIGEIRNMLSAGDLMAGIVVPIERDDVEFAEAISQAMLTMLNDERREKYSTIARELGAAYEMPNVAQNYIKLYDKYLKVQNKA